MLCAVKHAEPGTGAERGGAVGQSRHEHPWRGNRGLVLGDEPGRRGRGICIERPGGWRPGQRVGAGLAGLCSGRPRAKRGLGYSVDCTIGYYLIVTAWYVARATVSADDPGQSISLAANGFLGHGRWLDYVPVRR